ncbi:NTP transferase domain-containing protein [Marinicrinis sediminis]|uniref:NTP transferase domain-containing protein n=1 Tax=Marinicrinis sediminis TaxID=1652465 RepID=A0ABW5RE60_9BACL
MKPMNIVIAAAGAGHRFRREGFQAPKLIIETAGKPMLHWAMESLQPALPQAKVFVICLEADLQDGRVEQVIHSGCPHAEIIAIPELTDGQADTVLAARDRLDMQAPLCIYNCDTYMQLHPEAWSRMREVNPAVSGIVPVFQSNSPGYSYAEVNECGRIDRLREKEVISPYATTGLYHFQQAEWFVAAAEQARATPTGDSDTGSERYVAPLYNWLIEEGHQFEIVLAKACYPIGTPSERTAFVQWIHNHSKSDGR